MKKKVPWMIAFLLIAGLSIWAVMTQTRSFSFPVLILQLKECNKFYMLLAVASMFGYILFEGLSVTALIKGLTGKDRHKEAVVYSAADAYFSAITPSATGGQPATAFFMIKDGIDPASTTVILLINLIMYTYAMLAAGIPAILLEMDYFMSYTWTWRIFVLVGCVVQVALSIGYWMVLKHEKIVEAIVKFFIVIAEKLHLIHNGDQMRKRTDHHLKQFKECSAAIKGKRRLLVNSFIFNLLQRLSHSFVAVFVYLSMGGKLRYAFRAWGINIMCTVGYSGVPIPGAMGVADYLLLQGFDMLPDVANPANFEFVCRGLSFYVMVAVSVVIIICAYFVRAVHVKQYRD